MITVLLGVLCIVFLVKWLIQYISTLTVVYYILDKTGKRPTDKELRTYNKIVIKKLLLRR